MRHYLRGDTITAANAKLIEAQSQVPIVQFWGNGLLASVDRLRFVVPVRTISSAPSPKYFGFKRGITWLNAVNHQVAGIGQMVVPGAPRDSLHILDALLNLDGGVKPEMVATDNASYSDMVFGLFKILGYNFSPRFRDLDDQRFWRATMPGVETGTYGVLEDLARNRVNLNKVITHWPNMLKVAGSLVTNQVRAYDLLRMFGREGRPAPLGQAFAAYGRIAKTEHLLRVIDPVDDTYRRQMNRRLTVQESRHKLARDVCHGKRGTIHQAYRDGMEDQLGVLGLGTGPRRARAGRASDPRGLAGRPCRAELGGGEDRVQSGSRGGKVPHVIVEAVPLRAKPGDHLRAGDTGVHARQELHDRPAAQPGSVEELDPPHSLDRVRGVEALSARAAARRDELLLLVVAQRPRAHSRGRCHLADSHPVAPSAPHAAGSRSLSGHPGVRHPTCL